MNNEINDLISIAQRWREWEEQQITGENDEFLLEELQDKIEVWLLPRLMKVTIDDNEYQWFGSIIWDNVVILTLEIRQARLEKLIAKVSRLTGWQRCKRMWVSARKMVIGS